MPDRLGTCTSCGNPNSELIEIYQSKEKNPIYWKEINELLNKLRLPHIGQSDRFRIQKFGTLQIKEIQPGKFLPPWFHKMNNEQFLL